MRRDQLMGKCAVSLMLSITLLGGCAGRGDVIPVSLAAKPKEGATTNAAVKNGAK